MDPLSRSLRSKDKKIREIRSGLEQKLGRAISDEEVAKEMKTSIKKVKQIRGIITKTTSLEAPVGKDGTSQFVDFLTDDSHASTSEEVSQALREERIEHDRKRIRRTAIKSKKN